MAPTITQSGHTSPPPPRFYFIIPIFFPPLHLFYFCFYGYCTCRQSISPAPSFSMCFSFLVFSFCITFSIIPHLTYSLFLSLYLSISLFLPIFTFLLYSLRYLALSLSLSSYILPSFSLSYNISPSYFLYTFCFTYLTI